MKRCGKSLREQITGIGAYLQSATLLSLSVEQRNSLEQTTDKILHKLDSIEQGCLTMGLLGGTGVGKSTLMNALAGSVIAAASHRRPHTDHVLVYAHATAQVPDMAEGVGVPVSEIRHEAEAVRHIVLCDLPDFDSLVGTHRESVLIFLTHLDVLLWITSPEKYADGRFYELLRMVPKARANFCFVLNKADNLFAGPSLQSGYEQLESLTASYRLHLQRSGIDEPLVYALSAREALDGASFSPWNAFQAFRQYVFQQRDVKEMAAVKLANLDVEIEQMAGALRKELLQLESLQEILDATAQQFRDRRNAWSARGREVVAAWLAEHVPSDALARRADPAPLIGPGYALAIVMGRWQQAPADARSPWSPVRSEEAGRAFTSQVQWLREHLKALLLRRNLPGPYLEGLGDLFRTPGPVVDLDERFRTAAAVRLAGTPTPRLRFFRLRQWASYSGLFVLMLLTMGGEGPWRDVLTDPGVSSVLGLVLSFVHTLFSTKGLAALGSYALVSLFLAFRFTRRYKELLHRAGKRTLAALEAQLCDFWEQELDEVAEALDARRAQVRSQIEAIGRVAPARRHLNKDDP